MIRVHSKRLILSKNKGEKNNKEQRSDSVHSNRLILSKNKGEKNNKEQRSDSVHSNSTYSVEK